MKILVDMNLSPEWVPVLKGQGWEAINSLVTLDLSLQKSY
jgi:predicted nuclease of predicted toxin-antitoxin system